MFVSTMNLGGGRCGLNRGEGLQNAARVLRVRRDEPGIARLQADGLAFDLQFGPSRDHVTYDLILVLVGRLVLGRFFIPPQPHGHALA